MNEHILNYIRNPKNPLFIVSDIKTYRSSGIIVITATEIKKMFFYADKTATHFYSALPLMEENKINDPNLIAYLKESIEKYINRKQEECNRLKNMFHYDK